MGREERVLCMTRTRDSRHFPDVCSVVLILEEGKNCEDDV